MEDRSAGARPHSGANETGDGPDRDAGGTCAEGH